MNTNQKIAGVHLTSRFRQLLVAVLSVTFGISMYVFMNSFMAGVNNAQTQITFTSMPHIKIYNDLSDEVEPILPTPDDSSTVLMVNNARNIQYTEGIKNADAIKNELLNIGEITGVTEQLNQNVFIRNGVSKTSANLSGIETVGENQLFETSKYLTEGNLSELDKRSDGIILGTGLARAIGVNMGNNVSVTTSDGIFKNFKVIGLIETGSNAADKTRALVSIHTARQLFSKNKSYATEVLVNINDYYHAKTIAEKIGKLTDYKVEAWQDGNAQLDSANVLRDIVAVAVSLTILIVAGFGIYNIMNMTVNEKIKEIAILKAMGFNGKDVIEIFLTQSVVIGFTGGLVGLGFGNIIVRIVDNIPFKIATLDTLPVEYNISDYIMAFCFGIIITFIAGYLPARKASKVDPVEILRG
ncbi:MAG: FtsX-like permease family protein [Pseudosphingobacterium sp.]|nr:FtsX-like permease family protein [Pseudosphingobacterium sp.]